MRILCLIQPLRHAGPFFLRATRSKVSASLIQAQKQQRKLFSHCTDPESPMRLAKNQEAMQSVSQKDVADILTELEASTSSLTYIVANLRKEYDQIDGNLKAYYMRPGATWGFLVFRTVYGVDSDASWARMLEVLRSTVADDLSYYNQDDLLPLHELTVIEDEETLTGADAHTVRHVFRAWIADDLTPRLRNTEEYGESAQVYAKLLSNDPHDGKHPVSYVPPRWNFCLFVDEACLRSLDESSPSWSETVKILTSD